MFKLFGILILLLVSFSAHAQFLSDSVITRSLPNENSVCNVDLDQDGLKDLIVLARDPSLVYWYKNIGGTHFSERRILADLGRHAYSRSLKIEDFDQDGDWDFSYYYLSNTAYKHIFYRNNGNLQFTRDNFAITSTAGDLAFKDLNGDGLKDIVVSSNNYASHYKNLGNFQFQYVSAVTGSCAGGVMIEDLNNDGYNDIITYGSGFFIVNKNNGTGVFSLAGQVEYSNTGFDFEIFDYDQDGDLDVICIGSTSSMYPIYSVKVYPNNGAGVFTTAPITVFSTASGTGGIGGLSIMHLDNDNIPDLTFRRVNAVGANAGDANVFYRLSSTGGSFQPLVSNLHNEWGLTVAAIDINGDNKSELFASRTVGATDRREDFYIMSDTLSYNFVLTQLLDSFYQIGDRDDLIIEDLNDDGKPDLFTRYHVKLYSDTGDMVSVFVEAVYDWFTSYKLADLNGDDFPDIVGNKSEGLFYRLNNGAGAFGNQVTIASTVQSYSGRREFDLKDYDGDGDMDLLFTTENPDLRVHLCLNNGGLNFHYSSPYLLFNESGSGLSFVDALSLTVNKDQASNPNEISLAIVSDNYDKLSCSFFGSTVPYVVQESVANYSIRKVQIFDVDEDGLKDLVYILTDVVVWKKNLGNMTLGPAITLYTVGPVSEILLTDYDNDGDMDIAVSSKDQTSRVSILENLSFGNFADENIVFSIPVTFEGETSFRSGDYEGDGDQDLFVFEENAGEIFVLRNILNNAAVLQGTVFYDQNQNQVQDANEQGLINIPVQTTGAGNSGVSTIPSGNYMMNVFNGVHTVTAQAGSNWSLTTDSSAYHVNVQSSGQQTDSLNFGFFPTQLFDSAVVTLTGGFPRCNSIVNHWINTKNAGTQIQNGIVSMVLDSAVTFVSSNPIPDSISNGIYYWHYDNLAINDFNRINLHLQFPPFTSMGDDIISGVTNYILDQNGIVSDSVSDELSQVLVCGYDPNDKIVSPAGYEEEGYITNTNEWLEYTIRFQNTGNDTVFNVRIIDQISELLDISTFDLLGASHPTTVNVLQTNKLEFKLNNILLPDSGVNFLGSQGYVVFRIKLNPDLVHGQEIKNKASIFFDLNPPVITNTVLNTIYECPDEYVVAITNNNTCITNNVQAEVIEYSSLDDYGWGIAGLANSSGSSFSWSSDSAGTFDLTMSVTNPLCQQIDSVIPVVIHPAYSLIVDTLQICQGDSILIHGNYEHSSAVYTNQFNTLFGCDSTVGIYLNVSLPAFVTLADYPQNTICLQSGTVAVPAGLPIGGIYSGSGISGGVFDPSDAGIGNHTTYYTYVDANNCTSVDSVSLSVQNCLGIEEQQHFAYSVYPNPARESINVKQENGACFQVRLLSLVGEVLINEDGICSDLYVIDLKSVSKGTYFIELTDKESAGKEMFEIVVN